MTLVYEGWNWYVVQYVVEFRVISHPERTVSLVAVIQARLLNATSKEDAYARALSLQERIGDKYHNVNGDEITMTCSGTRKYISTFRTLSPYQAPTRLFYK
jgi:hypothetical protein